MAKAVRRKVLNFEEMLERLRVAYQDRLSPPLGGYVYRFTVYLPILAEGNEVFTSRQRAQLARIFHACFAGYSETAVEGYPPWYGSWFPSGAQDPIIDRHTLLVLYTPQTEEAKDFFRHLRWILEQKHVANQEVVLIEHTSAWLVEAVPLPKERGA